VPVVKWLNAPDASEEVINSIVFKIYNVNLPDQAPTKRAVGTWQDRPQLRLQGSCEADVSGNMRYLLGGQPPGSKKLYLVEADVYPVNLDREVLSVKSDNVVPELSKYQQAAEAKEGFGTAKAKRKVALNSKRQEIGAHIDDSDNLMSTLRSRAEEQLKSTQEQPQLDRDLPEHDAETGDTKKMYARGLELMVPTRILMGDSGLDDPEVEATLRLQPAELVDENKRPELLKIFGSQIAVAALLTRARVGTVTAESEILRLTAKFCVLKSMFSLYMSRLQEGRVGDKAYFNATLRDVASKMRLSEGSAFVKHCFSYFFEPTDEASKRQFQPKRLLCHLIVWSLHLTPAWALEVPFSAQRELKLDDKSLREAFEHVGCLCVRPPQKNKASQIFMKASLQARYGLVQKQQSLRPKRQRK